MEVLLLAVDLRTCQRTGEVRLTAAALRAACTDLWLDWPLLW